MFFAFIAQILIFPQMIWQNRVVSSAEKKTFE